MVVFLNKQRIYNILFSVALVLAVISMFSFNDGMLYPVMSVPVSGKIIVIDAGHGTPDGGATGVSGAKEKDINLYIAKNLGNYLMQSGAVVIYTREDDGTIADNLDDTIRNIKRNDMSKRKNIRDNSNADMFISIHMNIYSDPKYSGAQVFYKGENAESRMLANSIQNQIKSFVDPANTREAKNSKNEIFILNDSKIPSVLVECGFLSNPGEEKKLLTESYRDEISYAIYSGILKYLSNT